MLGTAILIAIIGTPTSLADALRVADDAYVFGIVSALVAGVVALTLTKVPSAAADTAVEAAAAA